MNIFIFKKRKKKKTLNIHKTKIMAPGPISLWYIHGETVVYFSGLKITADGDCTHEIK